jgi:hypothetical protein
MIVLHEVDVSPIIVAALTVDDRSYKAVQPLTFDAAFEPEDGVFIATGDFHMMVAADTRAELEDSVVQALVFLWREYVAADPKSLTADALGLRERLTATFEGGRDAA